MGVGRFLHLPGDPSHQQRHGPCPRTARSGCQALLTNMLMDSAVNTTNRGDFSAWHAITADEVLTLLDSNVRTGLASDEVSRRLEEYGRNQLPEKRKQGPLMRLLKQLNNILVYVLLAAGFIKLMVGLWLDAAIILGVVVINALLGFIQEG